MRPATACDHPECEPADLSAGGHRRKNHVNRGGHWQRSLSPRLAGGMNGGKPSAKTKSCIALVMGCAGDGRRGMPFDSACPGAL